jgi:hypothetical protein
MMAGIDKYSIPDSQLGTPVVEESQGAAGKIGLSGLYD